MSKRIILSKILTIEEKKQLRKRKLKQTELINMDAVQIAEMLRADLQRGQEIFDELKNIKPSIAGFFVSGKVADPAWADSLMYKVGGIDPLNIGIEGAASNMFFLDPATEALVFPYKTGISAFNIPAPWISNQKNETEVMLSTLTGMGIQSALGWSNRDGLIAQINVNGTTGAISGIKKTDYFNLAGYGEPYLPFAKAALASGWVGEVRSSSLFTEPGIYGKYRIDSNLLLNSWEDKKYVSFKANVFSGVANPLADISQLYGGTLSKNQFFVGGNEPLRSLEDNYTHYIGAPKETLGKAYYTGRASNLLYTSAGAAVSGSWLDRSDYASIGISAISSRLTASFSGSEIYDPKILTSMVNVSSMGVKAEQSLSGVRWADLGKGTAITAAMATRVQNDFTHFAADYGKVLHSIAQKPNWVYEAPGLVELSPNSFYTQSRLVQMVSVEEVEAFEIQDTDLELEEQNVAVLHQLLQQLDPEMIKMWNGAVDALSGNNPDFIRHFTISVRELYTHIIHRLAPDREFFAWDQCSIYVVNGKPTREGRLYYINRNLHGSKKEVSKFLNLEVKNTVDLMNILNGGAHGVTSSLTLPQLKMIKIKAEQMFISLLRIEFSINRVN